VNKGAEEQQWREEEGGIVAMFGLDAAQEECKQEAEQ
jgi:hypothetical protein